MNLRGDRERCVIQIEPHVCPGQSDGARVTARFRERDAQCKLAAPGQYVSVADNVRGFKEILDGQHDGLPESAFYMVGNIEEAVEKAAGMATESE